MKYCVQCGKTASWFVQNRCDPCYQAWKDSGKIKATPYMMQSKGWPETGMRLGGTNYSNHALFCRECKKSIPPRCYRQIYALKRGGECVTCDDCHEKYKALLRSSPPQCPSPTKSTEQSK